jgi:hypothetical protein
VPSARETNAGNRMRRIQIKSPKASHDRQAIAHIGLRFGEELFH